MKASLTPPCEGRAQPCPFTDNTPQGPNGGTGPAGIGRTALLDQHAAPTESTSTAFHDANLARVSTVGLTGSSLFDTEPHITAELSAICKNIQKIRDIRQKYMDLSSQLPDDNPKDSPDWDIYPPPPEPAWRQNHEGLAHWHGYSYKEYLYDAVNKNSSETVDESMGTASRHKSGRGVTKEFHMDDLLPLPGSDNMTFKLDDSGVYQVLDSADAPKPAVTIPTLREFYMDLDQVLNISSDGPSKSFAFRRLQYLEGKFNLYFLLNEYQETADSKKVPHRDFYNVRKVDTHVHHSACMNQKHLLRFIKSKMKKYPNEVVLFRDDKHLTLAEVFASIQLTAYDLSIDTLDMHVSISRPGLPSLLL